jgi:hypothetical protein
VPFGASDADPADGRKASKSEFDRLIIIDDLRIEPLWNFRQYFHTPIRCSRVTAVQQFFSLLLQNAIFFLYDYSLAGRCDDSFTVPQAKHFFGLWRFTNPSAGRTAFHFISCLFPVHVLQTTTENYSWS